jgi:dihydropteroate synthase
VGASRKSFIGSVDGSAPGERLGGTIAAALSAVERGARVLRVHDVQATRQALAVARLSRRPPREHGAAHA